VLKEAAGPAPPVHIPASSPALSSARNLSSALRAMQLCRGSTANRQSGDSLSRDVFRQSEGRECEECGGVGQPRRHVAKRRALRRAVNTHCNGGCHTNTHKTHRSWVAAPPTFVVHGHGRAQELVLIRQEYPGVDKAAG
jgi:hypothetical protein